MAEEQNKPVTAATPQEALGGATDWMQRYQALQRQFTEQQEQLGNAQRLLQQQLSEETQSSPASEPEEDWWTSMLGSPLGSSSAAPTAASEDWTKTFTTPSQGGTQDIQQLQQAVSALMARQFIQELEAKFYQRHSDLEKWRSLVEYFVLQRLQRWQAANPQPPNTQAVLNAYAQAYEQAAGDVRKYLSARGITISETPPMASLPAQKGSPMPSESPPAEEGVLSVYRLSPEVELRVVTPDTLDRIRQKKLREWLADVQAMRRQRDKAWELRRTVSPTEGHSTKP